MKVICKADSKNGHQWGKIDGKVEYLLFGLFKKTSHLKVPGPDKDEVCYVISKNRLGNYELQGYPHGYYDKKYFIPIEENENRPVTFEKIKIDVPMFSN